MKLTIKSLSIIVSVLVLLACEDFIDRPPVSNIVKENFYKTQTQFELATIGVYGSLQPLYRHRYIDLTELPSDNANCMGNISTTNGEFDGFSVNASNPTLSEVWINLFNSVQQVNVLLESVPKIDFVSEKWRDQRIGEAKFVRALSYFNLVRFWGDVPLLMETIDQDSLYNLIRAPKDSVYKAIIADLEFSTQHLPVSYSGSEIGRATKGAAYALLGKVYLTTHQFDKCVSALDSVIATGAYNLLTKYGDIFLPENSNNKESVFEIQFKGGNFDEGSRWGTSAHHVDLSGYFGVSTASSLLPHIDFRNFMDQTSTRYKETVVRVVYKTKTYDHIKKHYMNHVVQNQSEDNWPLIRYADVLLMHAEATNELNGPLPGAIEKVNQIRRRAYSLDLNGSNKTKDMSLLEYSTKEEFRETIWKERRAEFAYEGHRWFDLVRTGQYITVMNNHIQTYYSGQNIVVEAFHQYYPIPLRERDINPKLTQNEGYTVAE